MYRKEISASVLRYRVPVEKLILANTFRETFTTYSSINKLHGDQIEFNSLLDLFDVINKWYFINYGILPTANVVKSMRNDVGLPFSDKARKFRSYPGNATHDEICDNEQRLVFECVRKYYDPTTGLLRTPTPPPTLIELEVNGYFD
jgi:hypothetical protein